jgi:hypothetical protein
MDPRKAKFSISTALPWGTLYSEGKPKSNLEKRNMNKIQLKMFIRVFGKHFF